MIDSFGIDENQIMWKRLTKKVVKRVVLNLELKKSSAWKYMYMFVIRIQCLCVLATQISNTYNVVDQLQFSLESHGESEKNNLLNNLKITWEKNKSKNRLIHLAVSLCVSILD